MKARSKPQPNTGALEAGFDLPVRLVGMGPGPVAAWMHRGLDATTFHCAAGDQACFVKQYGPEDIAADAFTATRDASLQAAELGIAPRLLFSDEEQRILAFEDLSASHVAALRPWFDDPANVCSVRALMQRWHAAGIAGRDCDWIAGLSDHRIRIEARALTTGTPEAALVPAWDRIADLVTLIADRLAEPVAAPRPLHGELMISNVLRPLSAEGRVFLCDFDHSVNGDPLRDMAALWLEVSGVEDDAEQFADGVPGNGSQLMLWAIAEDLGWGFSAWEAHFDGRDPDVEYFKYARFRLNRALMNAVRTGLQPIPAASAW